MSIEETIERKISKSYYNMIRRCYNPKCDSYKTYGAAGITVCKEWKQDRFAFIEWSKQNGYEDGLTIDRIDVYGNYEPSNCRWISRRKNSNGPKKTTRPITKHVIEKYKLNKSKTNKPIIDYLKEKRIRPQWLAEKSGVSPSVVSNWINHDKTPNFKNLILIANGMGISTSELVGRMGL